MPNKNKPQASTSSASSKQTEPEYEKRELVSYDACEEWFNYQYVLMTNTGRQIQKRGNHSCNFEFTLPKNIPASLDHEIGNITYTAEAIIEQFE